MRLQIQSHNQMLTIIITLAEFNDIQMHVLGDENFEHLVQIVDRRMVEIASVVTRSVPDTRKWVRNQVQDGNAA